MAYQHKEAFALMWYACPCGHCERIWNSRDGVTPFCTLCPSCGQPSLQHVAWHQDQAAPKHEPHTGQRVWIDMSRAKAQTIASLRTAYAATMGRKFDPSMFAAVVDSIYRDGSHPDLRVHGYTEGEPQVKDGAPDRTT